MGAQSDSSNLVTACNGRVWEDPAVYGINKRDAHVQLKNFQSVDDGINYVSQIGRELSAQPSTCGKKLLNGKWQFKLFPNPDDVPTDFMKGDKEDEWTQVNVPGNWETQGFGRPVYTNFKYPFDVNPPYVPSDNPTGCYTTSFTLDSDTLSASSLALVFDGVDSAFAVWLNGVFVGYSQDSRLPAEFSVCDFCTAGSNLLAVQVMKWSDGSYLEDQDMWCLSGIFRDVYILERPKAAHITDYHLQTPLQIASDGALESAAVKAIVHMSAQDEKSLKEAAVKVHIYGPVTLGCAAQKNELIASVEGSLEAMWAGNDTTGQPNAQSARSGGRAALEISAEALQGKVAFWSAEAPAVYCAVVELCSQSDGTVIQVEATQLAFRQASIVNGKLLHNGSPVMMRGVNRHEHDEHNGKVVSEESMVIDILLMKQANFNAVRMSHYPNEQRFYQLCTALGLYAIDEANLETHGFDAALCKNYLNPANSHLWTPSMLDRAVRMFEQNKNHGCIIAWSIGNEAGYGAVHAAMSAFIRHRDPSRVLHYEGGGSSTPATDLICPMYARKPQVEMMANQHPDRPIVLCEYAHAMGNSGGGLAEYWRQFESNERCQGGFIWDWVDQGLMMKEGMPGYAGREYWCYGGDFGDPIHDAQFCINGLMFPNRQPHPSLHEIKHVQSPVHIEMLSAESKDISEPQFTVSVNNRYDFVPLKHVAFQWRVTVGGVPLLLTADKQSIVSQEYAVPLVPKVAGDTSAPGQLAIQCITVDPSDTQEQAWQALPDADGLNSLSPGQTVSMQLVIATDQLKPILQEVVPGTEVFLEVRAVTRESSFWAPKGHTVVCSQLNASADILKALTKPGNGPVGHSVQVSSSPDTAKLQVQSSSTAHVVSSSSGDTADWEATIDTATGMLTSWKKGACDVLQGPAELSLVRAPTDNDMGGSDGTAHASRWLALGLDRKLVPKSCTVTVQDASDSSVTIQVDSVLTATGESFLGEAAASGGASLEVGGAHWFAESQEEEEAPTQEQEYIDGSIGVAVVYTFGVHGVGIQWEVDISRFMPAQSCGHINSVARIGARLSLPPDLKRCTWMGRGPHENYIDRQDGALVRMYSSGIHTLHTPYVAPSENGGRGGVQWMALMPQQAGSEGSSSGCPVIVAAAQPVTESEECQRWPPAESDVAKTAGEQPPFCPRDGIHFSASYHSIEDLHAAKHDHELPEGGPCYLHLDGMHMGVGGDDSWTPSVHTRYLIRKGVYRFGIALQLLDGGASTEEVAKAASHMRMQAAGPKSA